MSLNLAQLLKHRDISTQEKKRKGTETETERQNNM